MSRVNYGQKWVNMPRHESRECDPSKVVRIHSANEDFHKAKTLASWLFLKYDMSYSAFRRKKKSHKDALRREYQADTGNCLPSEKQNEFSFDEFGFWPECDAALEAESF